MGRVKFDYRKIEKYRNRQAQGYDDLEAEELQATLDKRLLEKQYFQREARLFPKQVKSIKNLNSVSQLVAIEEELEQALVKLRERKAELARDEARLLLNEQARYTLQQGAFANQMMMEMPNGGRYSNMSDGQNTTTGIDAPDPRVSQESMGPAAPSTLVIGRSEVGSNLEPMSTLDQGHPMNQLNQRMRQLEL
ncbi:hypothetical protein R1flu_024363 [Riccia fluitans]|uniref:Uncharacterized protein n=1 Tax=Riccia fluitans TaxID=41844 RepID=A0ABD1XXP7_9MARC